MHYLIYSEINMKGIFLLQIKQIRERNKGGKKEKEEEKRKGKEINSLTGVLLSFRFN